MGAFLGVRRQLRLALQDGVEALDGRDHHLRRLGDRVAGQPLHGVQLAELARIVGRSVGGELDLRLLAQVGAVHQEEHASGAREREQPVNLRDRKKGLARSGGHLDEGPRSIVAEGLLQVGDAGGLVWPQPSRIEGRHALEPGAERGRPRSVLPFRHGALGDPVRRGPAGRPLVQGLVGHPLGQGFRSVNAEQRTAPRVGVQEVSEGGDLPGAQVHERQGPYGRAQLTGKAVGIPLGLNFHAKQRVAGGLGLQDGCGSAVDEEEVVHEAMSGGQLELPDGHAATGGHVHGLAVLDDPARFGKRSVDLAPGGPFGRAAARRCQSRASVVHVPLRAIAPDLRRCPSTASRNRAARGATRESSQRTPRCSPRQPCSPAGMVL